MIPKIIHQIWIGDKKKPDIYMKSWYEDYIKMYPDYKYCFWNETNIDYLLDFHPIFRTMFYKEISYCGRADIARYLILYYYGGIYIDADSVWINNKNLDELLNKSDDFFIGLEPNDKMIAVGVIGCSQYSKKIKFILNRLESISDKYGEIRRSNVPWKVTGPLLMSMLYKKNPTFKYLIVYHADYIIKYHCFDNYNSALEKFNSMNGGAVACILFDVCALSVLDKYGLEKYTNICVDNINSVYDKITIFPSHYFYPISWGGILDPQLHLKMKLDPECFMFQYGLSTNEFKLQY